MSESEERDRFDAGKIGRRAFLQWSALAAAAAGAGLSGGAAAYADDEGDNGDGEKPGGQVEEATIADLQKSMKAGKLTARKLVQMYQERIEALDRSGPRLRAIIEVNEHAEEIAEALDKERKAGSVRGPLHGIPILLKDNIDTVDMGTTAGSLALAAARPPQDATLSKKLRDAGAILLGKANLSEWANFRAARPVSGWSGVGRQGLNPYVLDRSPCGSSSGSGAAVSANLVTAALGTETNGSIVCPGSVNGVVALKPTVGLTSRAGVVPIAHSQDTVGPMCRTVADAAAVLGALTGVDARDEATNGSAGKFKTDYTQFLNPNGLQGKRIGIARQSGFGHEHSDKVAEAAIVAMRAAGAIIVEDKDLKLAIPADTLTVLLFEFKEDLNKYLATRVGLPVATLADLIAFNDANAAREMPYFLQELFVRAQHIDETVTRPQYEKLRDDNKKLAQEGIDNMLAKFSLDAIFAPTRNPTWTIDQLNGDRSLVGSSTPGAVAGYPLITVPAGMVFEHLPVGITFMGSAWSEPALIEIASGFEAATKARRKPRFLRHVDLP
jgi:amidase